MPEQAETEWATIGKVVAPFGLKGELKVFPLTDIPNRFTTLKTLYLGPQHTPRVIKSVRPYKGEMLVMRIEGIDDANAAETLRNMDIAIPLEQLAALPPDSYYQHDILGLQVRTLEGRDVGKIVDIIVTGSNDVYVIQSASSSQILIPAIKDVIKQVDLIRKMMYIDPIPGLLEDTEDTEDAEDAEDAKAEEEEENESAKRADS